MAAFTNKTAEEILNYYFRGVSLPAAAANTWLAAFTSPTTDAGGGIEVTGGAYARVQLPAASAFSAPAGEPRSITNLADIEFVEATANWGTITHVGLMDAATGGNMIMHGALSAPKVINSGNTLEFKAGELDLTAA